MSMVAVKAHERRKPVNAKQEELHDLMRRQIAERDELDAREWALSEQFTAELLPHLEAIYAPPAFTPREGDPHSSYRSMFSHMPAFAAGRAMASHIIADTRMDLIDMEAVVAEALADDDFMQMAEGFPLDGGIPLI